MAAFYCFLLHLVYSCQIREMWKDFCLCIPDRRKKAESNCHVVSYLIRARRFPLLLLPPPHFQVQVIYENIRTDSFQQIFSKWPRARTPRLDPQHTKVNIKSNNWICFLSCHHQGTDNDGEEWRISVSLALSGIKRGEINWIQIICVLILLWERLQPWMQKSFVSTSQWSVNCSKW